MIYVRLSTLMEWQGEKLPCPPQRHQACGLEITLARQRIERMTDAELAQYDLVRAMPFSLPEDRKSPSKRRFERRGNRIHEIFDTEPIAKADLIQRAKALRWNKEVEGIEVDGIAVATDENAQVKILGARLAAERDRNWSTPWHAADGTTHMLDAAAMIELSNAVNAHIKATFVTLNTVKTGIEAQTITTFDQVDQALA
jgi:hypothetical protein